MRATHLAGYAQTTTRIFDEPSVRGMRIKEGVDENLLAQKYARAFITVFGDQLTLEKVDKLYNAAEFLAANQRIIFFMKLAMIDDKIKKQSLDFLCKRFNLDDTVKKLMLLLLKHKRLSLLEYVLRTVSKVYKNQAGIELFTLISSHELSEHDKQVLKQFLEQQTGHTIMYNYKIDKQLIAGIRMQSDQHLWEYSIAKQLHAMQLTLIY
ncbi:MAG: ATP synthase F1 subunit delta [bacterium]|nr:ATP synthase F1 subunit delta [bacterium]